MAEYKIEMYTKPNGESPAQDFIMSLDSKMQSKVFREIDSLELFGPSLREPISKHLEDGIFEIRAIFANNITRVLYFFYIGKTIVLTNGFVKKTQKTPRSEIDKAKRYRADYLSRKE